MFIISESYSKSNLLLCVDIFVRNAFGNYFDILKEVSYSPMMAEMLSYRDSKSKPYVFKTTGNVAFPDENYAREIMQVSNFSILSSLHDRLVHFVTHDIFVLYIALYHWR